MKTTIPAIYEKGVFRPLRPMSDLRDKDEVSLIVLRDKNPISECIGVLSDDAADEMRRAVEGEFEKVDPNEWK